MLKGNLGKSSGPATCTKLGQQIVMISFSPTITGHTGIETGLRSFWSQE